MKTNQKQTIMFALRLICLTPSGVDPDNLVILVTRQKPSYKTINICVKNPPKKTSDAIDVIFLE